MSNDPSETQDLAKSHPEIVQFLQLIRNEWRASMPDPVSETEKQPPDEPKKGADPIRKAPLSIPPPDQNFIGPS